LGPPTWSLARRARAVPPALAWVTTLGVMCPAAPASAAPLGAELAVERSAEAQDCPGSDELTVRVERILQRPLPKTHEPTDAELVRIAVEFARSSAGYTATLHFSGRKTGERHLLDRGAICEALADAVSVTIALSLDRELELQAARSESQAAGSPDEKPGAGSGRASPSVAPASAAAEPRMSGHAWDLSVLIEGGPALGFGAPAAFTLAEHLQARLRPSWLFDLGFHTVLPSTADSGAGGVRTSWLFGSARVCYVWGGDYAVGPCTLFGAGRLRGVGVGYRESRSDDLTWTALGGAVLAQGPLLGAAFWGLSGTLWGPLRRLTFSVENLGVVWRASPVSGGVMLGAGVRFR
jgi:hypothetical protein